MGTSSQTQVANQLFGEHGNYFSHMSRLFKAPARSPTSGRRGLRLKTLFATNKPSLLALSLVTICSFISHCLSLKGEIISTIPSTTITSLGTNPHPYPIHLITVRRGKCHYGNRGRGSGELSMGKVGGAKRKMENDCELGNAGASKSQVTI